MVRAPACRYRLGVRTRGSQPRDRGSNPRTGILTLRVVHKSLNGSHLRRVGPWYEPRTRIPSCPKWLLSHANRGSNPHSPPAPKWLSVWTARQCSENARCAHKAALRAVIQFQSHGILANSNGVIVSSTLGQHRREELKRRNSRRMDHQLPTPASPLARASAIPRRADGPRRPSRSHRRRRSR
jgi:hypothetical protein